MYYSILPSLFKYLLKHSHIMLSLTYILSSPSFSGTRVRPVVLSLPICPSLKNYPHLYDKSQVNRFSSFDDNPGPKKDSYNTYM